MRPWVQSPVWEWEEWLKQKAPKQTFYKDRKKVDPKDGPNKQEVTEMKR